MTYLYIRGTMVQIITNSHVSFLFHLKNNAHFQFYSSTSNTFGGRTE